MIKDKIKKKILKFLKLNIKNDILTLSRDTLFLKQVFIADDNNKIYFIKTKYSFVLNLKTVDILLDYNLYLEISILSKKFKVKVPFDLIQHINNLSLYYNYMKKPIKKGTILFESFFGKSYSGQPKYIYEYLVNNNYKYNYIWVYQGNKPPKSIENSIIVKRGSRNYYKYLATAEYWINNIVFPVAEKREETTYIQTWHGTPLKRLGYDIDVEGPEIRAREKFYKQSRGWDYLLTQNGYTTDILKRAFKFDKDIVECGYPHNDILIENSPQSINKIKESLYIPQNKKVILYAPTWRDNDSNGNWTFNFSLKIDLLKWQEIIGQEYVILIRMHHLITNIRDLNEVEGFAINVSKYDDIQELSLISDILITDYSSVFFDFAVTKKPILFFAYDYKEYAEELRGFYLDMYKDMPGPMVENDKELLEAILNIKVIESKYKDIYKEFRDKFCYLDSGLSSKEVIEKIFKDKNG